MDLKIEVGWVKKLAEEFDKAYFKDLVKFIEQEYNDHQIYPPKKEIFNAFNFCTFDQTRVVIIGQDPYHGIGQAHGLCFSVNKNIKPPPSLVNIFKEIKSDLNIDLPLDGNLTRWASQGVLLLNAALTVRASQPGSHQKRGWEIFTDRVIKLLSDEKENLVFLLWGAYAQKKGAIINRDKHLVLESAHPSPFASYRGFFGNKHFSKTNNFLEGKKLKIIEW